MDCICNFNLSEGTAIAAVKRIAKKEIETDRKYPSWLALNSCYSVNAPEEMRNSMAGFQMT